jgi:hypothetical protein
MAAIMEVEEHLTAKFIQFDPAPRRGGETMPGVQASRRRCPLRCDVLCISACTLLK